jgi:hypothetical protein
MASHMKTSRKERVIAALRASVAADLAALEAAAHAAHDAATHPEARPESDKDTRALEAGYLAGAQSARAAVVKRTAHELALAEARVFSLLTLREDVKGRATKSLVLLSPWGGGQKLVVDDDAIAVVTPQSPLGAALVGKVAGDIVEVEAGGRVRELEVVADE